VLSTFELAQQTPFVQLIQHPARIHPDITTGVTLRPPDPPVAMVVTPTRVAGDTGVT